MNGHHRHAGWGRAIVLIVLSTVLAGCFGASSSWVGGGDGYRAGGSSRLDVVGRVIVDIDADLPPVEPLRPSARRLPRVLPSVAGGPAEFTGLRSAVTFSSSATANRRARADGERFWLLSASGAAPNDPWFPDQWNLDLIRMREAWALIRRDGYVLDPVSVAIVDTRVCTEHEDILRGWVGFDLVDEDDREAVRCPGDHAPSTSFHGTLVAGILASQANNGRGIASVSWVPQGGGMHAVRPMAVRVLRDDGWGSTEQLARGIVKAAEEGARVINLSLGVYFDEGRPDEEEDRQLLADALEEAMARGALLVAAAGNEPHRPLAFPAAHPGVLAVGATTPRGEKADYSNEGQIDIVAPGGDRSLTGERGLLTTWGTGDYTQVTGTSMAAPHVSAAAAMLMALGVERAEDVADVLKFTARSITDGATVLYDKADGHSPKYGWGMLDVAGALRLRVMPQVFLARETEPAVEAVSRAIRPGPDGRFALRWDGEADRDEPLYLVAWADSNQDGVLSDGDFYGEVPVRPGAGQYHIGSLELEPYRGASRVVRGLER